MKKLLSLCAGIILCGSIFAQNTHDIYAPGDDQSTNEPQQIVIPRAPAVDPVYIVLYDNGPLVTHPGGGSGGSDASVVQTALGMNTYGFGHQFFDGNWVADDFTVPVGGWSIKGFHFYAYQTGSTLTSTITGMHIMIYDGNPDGGANLIFGDNTTNRLTSTDFINIFRVLDTDLNNTTRPIMQQLCEIDLYLPQGTYWVAWQTDGTLSSGPWCPPVTILGQTSTGNAVQYTPAGGWQNVFDTGTSTPPGLPFQIVGSPPVPMSNWALFIGVGLILVFTAMRFRKLN